MKKSWKNTSSFLLKGDIFTAAEAWREKLLPVTSLDASVVIEKKIKSSAVLTNTTKLFLSLSKRNLWKDNEDML